MSARKPWTLSEHLAELERTNPEVKAAAENVDRIMDQIARGDTLEGRWQRINARRAAEGKEPIGPFVRRQRATSVID